MTNRQDWHVCELAQAGISSRGYRPGPYSNREDLLYAFDRFIVETLEEEPGLTESDREARRRSDLLAPRSRPVLDPLAIGIDAVRRLRRPIRRLGWIAAQVVEPGSLRLDFEDELPASVAQAEPAQARSR